MPSLRLRLLLGTAGATAAVLLVAGFAVYALMRADLHAAFDEALIAKTSTLAGMVEQEGRRVELEFIEADSPEFNREDRPEYFQVWNEDESTIARSPSLRDADLPLLDVPFGETAMRNQVLPDGRPGRVAILQFVPRPDGESGPSVEPRRLTLAVARDLLDVDAALSRLQHVLLLVGVIAILVSVITLDRLVGVGLKPANALAQRISTIDEKQLATQLDAAPVPLELRPIVDRLNELLARLNDAFLREKTMTADVAHELRNPLAGLITTLEVGLAREREPADYRKTITDCLTICRQLQSTVENLLALARLDAGRESPRRESVHVETLLRTAWQPYEPIAEQRSIDVCWDLDANLAVETDADKLRLVLGNLLENAVSYSDAGGDVLVRSVPLDGVCRIEIANTGCSLPHDDAHRVFDRFWRGDHARQDTGIHSGLGLPLCKAMMERLGGTINAEIAGERFSITIIIPQ